MQHGTVQPELITRYTDALGAEREAPAWAVTRVEELLASVEATGDVVEVHRLSPGQPTGPLAGRTLTLEDGATVLLGDVVPDEGGLGWPAGTNLAFEPAVEAAAGVFWTAVTWRLSGRLAAGGVDFAGTDGTDPLTWPDWHPGTGRRDTRDWRLDDGAWRGRLTRAVVGARLGRWALSLGWDQRLTGPGLSGDLNLDHGGLAFPALTARRTAPFRWSGIMTHLAPDDALLRVGQLSRREVRYALRVRERVFQDEGLKSLMVMNDQIVPLR